MNGKLETEKIILAEIYKQDGLIHIDFPNDRDVHQYELFGFLDCYLDKLKQGLIDCMEETK